jgi:ketosteroid isomerase-like protein
MYHQIVQKIVKQGFRELSQGNFEHVVQQFAPKVVFSFMGDHPLGGERHGQEETRAWFQKLHGFFPNLILNPLEIVVVGLPWNTMVRVRFTVKATVPGGMLYTNEGVQVLRLRWGKITEDRIYEDTAKLVKALEHIARHGKDEAMTKPLITA